MKKRILIVSHALELGGAERSLIGLLDAIDPQLCDVDLFLLRHAGELMGAIPEHVCLLPVIPAYTVLARPMKDTLREGHILLTAARLLGKLVAKGYIKKHGHTESGVPLEYSHKFTCPFLPKIQPEEEYDLAVSFLTPHYFVARKVRAKKKIAWIHTDYSQIQVDVASELSMWDSYDSIATISDAVTEGFCSVFPSLAPKLVAIRNILPEQVLRMQSRQELCDQEMPADGSTRLLSVGRYCAAKNFDNVPDICARLVQMGLDVKWYLIGFGGDEPLIRRRIKEAGMEERVILLGKKENPYPYIAACDLYVQPSRYEGNCVTVREAQMLGKPVVITAYPTAPSQLEDGMDGLIVPMENGRCADGLVRLLRDSKKMEKLSHNCRQNDYSNRAEVRKLYEMVN